MTVHSLRDRMRPLRIGQIAPLIESCPPRTYGGTERIVSYLTEELVRQGHDVTLFASADSHSSARLVACTGQALRFNPEAQDAAAWHVMMLDEVRRRALDFDVLHFHIDMLHYALMRPLAEKVVTTLHGRLDQPDQARFYGGFPELPLVSISDDQRKPLPPVNWAGTVHHGLPHDLLPFGPAPRGNYLAFLGRICPEKRPDRAIEIARLTGMPLRIAAKIDKVDEQYWQEEIWPTIAADDTIRFVGEIDEQCKAEFLGNARALLFPIDWPEPFGLVMIEAMACGTPVIALNRGSVPEVIEHGVTGFIVETIEEAARAVTQLDRLDRRRVRAAFEERFTVERMARDYVDIYRRLPQIARDYAPTGRVAA